MNCIILLSRVSIPMNAERDIVTVNPSVRLSVTLWYCIETNAQFVKLFPPSGRSMTNFLSASAVTKFQGTAAVGALNTRGLEKLKSLILETVRDRPMVIVDN